MTGCFIMIFNKNSTHRTATFVILVPDVEDYHGHVFTADEIIKTAHEFMQNIKDKYVNVNHEPNTIQTDVIYVESFIAPVDIEVWGGTIKAGSWMVGMQFSEEKWKMIEDGEIVWVSMEGKWYSIM